MQNFEQLFTIQMISEETEEKQKISDALVDSWAMVSMQGGSSKLLYIPFSQGK